MDDIRQKLASLIRLAKAPGTKSEGEAAREAAVRISLKYSIPCEFTKVTPPAPSDDLIFHEWIKALGTYGWTIHDVRETKIGRQICFRHCVQKSEIRVIQRKNADGREFEAEHIMKPDPVNGYDLSYMSFFTIHLSELLRHVAYSKPVW